jgi:hypothetical protein
VVEDVDEVDADVSGVVELDVSIVEVLGMVPPPTVSPHAVSPRTRSRARTNANTGPATRTGAFDRNLLMVSSSEPRQFPGDRTKLLVTHPHSRLIGPVPPEEFSAEATAMAWATVARILPMLLSE